MPTEISPFTNAARALTEAAFGNPAIRAEQEKLAMERDLTNARIRSADASVTSSNASAANALAQQRLRESQLGGINNFSKSFADLLAKVEDTQPAQLPPGVFGPGQPITVQRAPTIDEFQARLPDFIGNAVKADQGTGNFADLLMSSEGLRRNLFTADPDARARNFAAGAGSPFSETETKAQVFANLPQNVQDIVAGAVPTDQVFGGALATQRSPEQNALLATQKAQPASIAEFLFSEEDPRAANGKFAQFATDTSGGTKIQIGPDGSVSQNSPLTTSQTGAAQESLLMADSGIAALDDAISSLTAENAAIERGEATTQTGSFVGAAIAPGSSENSLIKAANTAFELARVLPPLEAVIDRFGAGSEEVQRVRANRLKIQNAAVAMERRIANGSQTGQFTQRDAQDARNATQLITLSGDNNEIISQLNELRKIAGRERALNASALREGLNVTAPGQGATQAVTVDSVEQYNALPVGATYIDAQDGQEYTKGP